MNDLAILSIICASLVLGGMSLVIFYLSKMLADTNRHLLAQNQNVMRHALAINEDCREFERIRKNEPPRGSYKTHTPSALYPQEPVLPIDGQMPVNENGTIDYAAFERGGVGGT